jgi:hypothetical protein
VKRARLLLVLTLVAGCSAAPVPNESRGEAGSRAAGRAADERPASRSDWFVDRAEASGLAFSYFNGMSGQFYFPEMLPGGVALFDYDNDGDLDVYFVQGQMLGEGRTTSQALFPPPAGVPLKGRLFRNDLQVRADGTRTLHFTDVTDRSGIDARGYGMGVAAADFDNDGCVDLYLTNFGPNRLFRNNCDGTFTDVSKASGTEDAGWSVSASFVDYDRDGWLDLYVAHYVQYDLKGDRPCTGLTGRRDYCTPAVYQPQPDRLYHNEGNGRFTDVTAKALRGGAFGPGLGVVSADFNNDGWMDIYVANDGRENLLWMNQRDGTFKNTGPLSGAAVNANGRPQGSMGVDAGDFDNDGDDDLVVTELPAEGTTLYVNDGSGLFEDMSAHSGVGPASLGSTGFGAAWIDVDGDGWLDILAVNGSIEAAKDRAGERFPYDERKLLFRNLGNGRFTNVSREAGAVFMQMDVSRGAAFGDIDNDGDMDVVVNNINGPARLLVNEVGNRNHWLGLRLLSARIGAVSRGRQSTRTDAAAPGRPFEGRDALGARVEIVRKNGPTLWRRARSDGSYASANDPRLLVGLGESTELPTIRVHWPGGGVETWPAAGIDRWTTLNEGEGR